MEWKSSDASGGTSMVADFRFAQGGAVRGEAVLYVRVEKNP